MDRLQLDRSYAAEARDNEAGGMAMVTYTVVAFVFWAVGAVSTYLLMAGRAVSMMGEYTPLYAVELDGVTYITENLPTITRMRYDQELTPEMRKTYLLCACNHALVPNSEEVFEAADGSTHGYDWCDHEGVEE